jgi:NAD(P)-dependent dehydrogenase (short-subunit alcohol dehydrogenase family)
MIFHERIVVLTGGTSGIGLAIATRLVQEQAVVILLGRDVDKGRAAEKQLGTRARFISCDVANPADVQRAFDEIRESYGRLDLAVNNAGVTTSYGPLDQIAAEEWDRAISINLNGIFYCLQQELRMISKQPSGAIVNISSCAGLMAIPNQAAYVTSKASIHALTKAAALEFGEARDGKCAVRVNAVAPGPTMGGMNTPERLAAHPTNTQRKLNSTAMRRFAEADEIASAVIWLLSDASSYVTGAVMPVDGGYSAGKML